MNILSYLEFAGLPVHGKRGVVHRAHELDAGRHHVQHLVPHAHPQPLQGRLQVGQVSQNLHSFM